jgi:hypothetical protein
MILSPYQKPPLGSKLNYGHPLAKGLVLSMLMNEGSGDRVQDYSGNGNHGTCVNMAPQSATSGWVPGPHGPCIAFDGIDDIINTSFKLPDAFTLCASINVPNTNFGYILFQNNAYISLKSEYQPPKTLIYLGGINYAYVNQSPVNTIDGSFHQIIITLPGKEITDINSTEMYADGKSQTFASYVATGVQTNRGIISIGGHNLNGTINYLYIYERVLTSQEVAQIYVSPYCMFNDLSIPAWMYSTGGVAPIMHHYKQLRS